MQIANTKDFLYKIQKNRNQAQAEIGITSDRKNILDLKILVCVDISGSISAEQYTQFMQQIDAIRGLSVVKVIEVDDRVVAYYDYFKTSQDEVMRLKGGGGTEFREAFEMAKKIKPDAILFMTDGYVTDICRDPEIPVGWVLTSHGVHPYGFGEVVLKLPAL